MAMPTAVGGALHHHLAPNGYAGFVLANGSMCRISRGKGISGARSSRQICGCMWRCPTAFLRSRFPCACGSSRKQSLMPGAASRPPQTDPSSTPVTGTLIRTASTRVLMSTEKIASPTTPWRGGKTPANTKTFAFVSRHQADIARTATFRMPLVGAEEVEDEATLRKRCRACRRIAGAVRRVRETGAGHQSKPKLAVGGNGWTHES